MHFSGVVPVSEGSNWYLYSKTYIPLAFLINGVVMLNDNEKQIYLILFLDTNHYGIFFITIGSRLPSDTYAYIACGHIAGNVMNN